jgi:hypothetical protein
MPATCASSTVSASKGGSTSEAGSGSGPIRRARADAPTQRTKRPPRLADISTQSPRISACFFLRFHPLIWSSAASASSREAKPRSSYVCRGKTGRRADSADLGLTNSAESFLRDVKKSRPTRKNSFRRGDLGGPTGTPVGLWYLHCRAVIDDRLGESYR